MGRETVARGPRAEAGEDEGLAMVAVSVAEVVAVSIFESWLTSVVGEVGGDRASEVIRRAVSGRRVPSMATASPV